MRTRFAHFFTTPISYLLFYSFRAIALEILNFRPIRCNQSVCVSASRDLPPLIVSWFDEVASVKRELFTLVKTEQFCFFSTFPFYSNSAGPFCNFARVSIMTLDKGGCTHWTLVTGLSLGSRSSPTEATKLISWTEQMASNKLQSCRTITRPKPSGYNVWRNLMRKYLGAFVVPSDDKCNNPSPPKAALRSCMSRGTSLSECILFSNLGWKQHRWNPYTLTGITSLHLSASGVQSSI